ncbi:hypothetical protein DB347_02325 [Opitutaceae bacterium EW11]|nr:hypothetical protein DB347_02325 [Opitutaceae bacterium EW11]
MSPSIPVVTPELSTVPAWRVFLRSADHRLIRAGLTALLGIAIARYLGPEEFGLLSSAVGMASILLAFSSLGLDRLVREEVEGHPTDSATILGTAMGLRLAAAGLAYLVLLIAAPAHHPGLRLVWLVASLATLSHIPLTVECWLSAKKQTRPCTLALNVGFGLTVLLSLAFMWNGVSAVWFAAVLALEAPFAALLIFHAYGKLAPNEDTFDWSTPLAKRWVRRCWSTVAVNVAVVGLLQLNPVLLAWIRGPLEAGRYAAASRFFEVICFGIVGLSVVRMTRIREARGAKDLDFAALAPVMANAARTAWCFAIVAAGTALWAMSLIFGQTYNGSALTFGILSFALIPQVLSLVGVEALPSREGEEQRVLRTAGVGLGLNLVLGCWWSVWWGAPGAAAAGLVGSIAAHLIMPRFDPATRELARVRLAVLTFRNPFPAQEPLVAVPAAPISSAPSLSKDSPDSLNPLPGESLKTKVAGTPQSL